MTATSSMRFNQIQYAITRIMRTDFSEYFAPNSTNSVHNKVFISLFYPLLFSEN